MILQFVLKPGNNTQRFPERATYMIGDSSGKIFYDNNGKWISTQFNNKEELLTYVIKRGYEILNDTINNNQVSSGCQHEYKHYTGLVEQFIYCIKCDIKKVA